MTLDEARAEFQGALAQLRDRTIREELDALVAGGLEGEAERARYQWLRTLRPKG